MPIGVVVNTAAVLAGGFMGNIFLKELNEHIKIKMNWIFGVCSLGMGVSSVAMMRNMPAVVFSVIVGTLFGLALNLGRNIERITDRFLGCNIQNMSGDKRELMMTAIVIFCVSGTGIYGALDSGMTGNHSILITKSVLDFFTAAIFACQLGKTVCLISIPQFVILLLLYILGGITLPILTTEIIQDFRACGGFLLLATSFRMMQLRAFPVADMIPAMVLVMPVSSVWVQWVLPLIT